MSWYEKWLESAKNWNTYLASVDEVQKLKDDYEDAQFTLTLIRSAQRRATKRWQEKTGQAVTWPDMASLIVWLMEENDSLRKQNQKLLEQQEAAHLAGYDFYEGWI